MEYVLFATIHKKKIGRWETRLWLSVNGTREPVHRPLQDQSKEIKELQTKSPSHFKSYSTNSLCPKRVQLGWLGCFVPSHHNDSAEQAQTSAGLGQPVPSLWPHHWEGLCPAWPDRSSGLDPAGCQALCTRRQHLQVTFPRKEPRDRVLGLLTHFVGFSGPAAT